MAKRYAMLDGDDKVRRVTYGSKPHPDALEVEYPKDDLDDIDRVKNHVRQKPPREWDVDKENGKVTVTYEVTEKDLDEMKRRKLRRIEAQRKHVEADGTHFEDEDGNERTVRTDSQTQAKIASAKSYLEDQPEDTKVDWQRLPEAWSTVNLDQLKTMANAIGDHVQAAFSRQKELEDQVKDAETHQEVHDIRVNSGWPESAGLADQ